MAKNTALREPFRSDRPRTGAPSFETLAEDERRDRLQRRRTVLTLVLAAVAHLGILILSLPESAAEPVGAPTRGPVYVVQPVRFEPPPPQQQKKIPRRKAKRIPIPDPTPDDPEPIFEDEMEVELELDFAEGVEFAVTIPDAPPGSGRHPGAVGALEIGNGILPPRKINAPRPPYTEEARAARIQGSVLLHAVVTAEGQVVDVKVLKGLPMGLTESAVEMVQNWTYEPATKDGKAVPVYQVFTINFRLQ